MRLLMGMLLLVSLPLRAAEPSEEQKLVWLNYQLAVAETPGDARSDLRLRRVLKLGERLVSAGESPAATLSEPMRAYQARAQVVAAELDASIDAARDSDPFVLAGDLDCWPRRDDMSLCDRRRASLEAFVPDNAYFGLVLMTQAWARKDDQAFLRVARLAAAADGYDSLGAVGFQSLVQRYRQVPAPALADMDALTRSHTAEVMAMAVSMATPFPVYSDFVQPCQESQGELRDHCLAIARKMLFQGQYLLEAWSALPLVEAIGTPADIEAARDRRHELEWLRTKSFPLLGASGEVVVAGMDAYLTAFGTDGELAAMRALLAVHGIPALPPAGWPDASAEPADSE